MISVSLLNKFDFSIDSARPAGCLRHIARQAAKDGDTPLEFLLSNGSMLTAAHQNAERGTFLTIAAFRCGRFAVLRPLGLDLP